MRVVSADLDVETRGGERDATLEGKCGERRGVPRRSEPVDMRSDSWREGAESIQHDIEGSRSVRDGSHHLDGRGGSLLVNRPKEMHGQVERLGTRPANLGNALPELILQPSHQGKCRLSDRDGEEAPQHYGLGLAFGVAAAGLGVCRARVHGEPPALVSVTSILLC